MKKFLFGIALVLSCTLSFGQKNVTTFGIQIKPIIPSSFFNTGASTLFEQDIQFDIEPFLGYNFGMLMRQGFTKNISLESGISIVRRNYRLKGYDPNNNNELNMEYSFIGYEIPVQALLYVRLGDKLWMNAAGGLSFDFYPSNIYSNTYNNIDTLNFELEQSTKRVNWVQVSLISNLGFEYRTKDKGYFYLGTSFHQPFNDIGVTVMRYSIEGAKIKTQQALSGSYLTVDLRYFFNEKPEKRKPR